ncbi:DgyrCDS9460 [Dimorphilus gyrociliatus]|uniref:DgyrCDS9460 n=1 Tax=Dimorphilus gyrociliatus TaxID=2664684 RepID=A0A7I8VZ87_9ANNE|nr:DgyrCDS9460 [Dimorphilus gyrociliatus]
MPPLCVTIQKLHYSGGPLEQGDIEDFMVGRNRVPCVKCPWHNWRINLLDGKVVSPNHVGRSIETYPVKLDKDGRIIIGFKDLHPKVFTEFEGI